MRNPAFHIPDGLSPKDCSADGSWSPYRVSWN